MCESTCLVHGTAPRAFNTPMQTRLRVQVGHNPLACLDGTHTAEQLDRIELRAQVQLVKVHPRDGMQPQLAKEIYICMLHISQHALCTPF